MNELWRDIPDYKGFYQVSTFGKVKSLTRFNWMEVNNCYRKLTGKELKFSYDNKDYFVVNLSKNGKYKTLHVHKLVAMAFLGHVPNGNKGLVIDHIDNNPRNNRLDNIQLITNSENLKKGVKYRKNRSLTDKTN